MLLALATLNLQPSTAFAQGTTVFTYQGQLRDGGTNANGAYTMIFALYDAVTNGDQIGVSITNSLTLANGLFTVNLDFGATPFNGSAVWLDITITNGGTTQELSPRVAITPAPYALYAMSAGNPTSPPGGGGTINTTNITLGSGGTSWDISVNSSNALTFSYGDPLVTVLDSNGNLDIPDNIDAGGAIVANGGKISGKLHADVVQAGNFTFSNGDATISYDNAIGATVISGDVSVSGNITANGDFSANGYANFNGPLNVTPVDLNVPAAIINGETDIFGRLNVQHSDIFADGNISSNGDIHGNNVEAAGDMWATSFNQWSDRNLKEKFTPIDNREILERVASLPISRWNFKTDEQTRHIGPMSQDFYAAFNVGPDDKHIATVDEGGVALAAIQGLNQKLNEKDAEIQALKQSVAELKETLTHLTQQSK